MTEAFKQGFDAVIEKCAEDPSRFLVSKAPDVEVTPSDLDTAESAEDTPPTQYTKEQSDALRRVYSNLALWSALEGKPPAAFPWPRATDSNPEFATTGQYLGKILENGNPWKIDAVASAGSNLSQDLRQGGDPVYGRSPVTQYPFDSNVSNYVNRVIFDNLKTPATSDQTNNLYRALQVGIGK